MVLCCAWPLRIGMIWLLTACGPRQPTPEPDAVPAVDSSTGQAPPPAPPAWPPAPFDPVGHIDGGRFEEASGIAFHAERNTLFVVTDEGDVGEIDKSGRLIQRRHLLYEDFEGITVDPSTGLLYIVIEGRDNVLEVAPDGLAIRREFDIDRTFEGRRLFDDGGNGLEGITFAPDPDLPATGRFLLVNRARRAADDDDPSLLVSVSLPLASRSDRRLAGTITGAWRLDVPELSGVSYDAAARNLFAVSHGDGPLLHLDSSGTVLGRYSLPVDAIEGIAIDDEGFLYLALDPGGVLKLAPRSGR